MKTALIVIAVLLAVPAFAQDTGLYNRALQAYNAGDYDTSAQLFFEVNNTATDPEVRAKSEYYLASSFHKHKLPFTAFVYYALIAKSGKAHPFYLKAVEGLVNVQEEMDEQYLIPNLLEKNYNSDWATLPAEVLSRINYVIAGIDQRRSKFDEAKEFLQAVPKDSAIYVKAQYLLGVVLADPRYPGGTQAQDAENAFMEVLATNTANQKDLVETHQLAYLGLGRVYYGTGEFQKSTENYEKIPRFSKYWHDALFENSFARFQNEDVGGALGSLQALHAPQFTGAFEPESWILKATAYYYSCLYNESKSALSEFDKVYGPMADQLRPVVETEEKDTTVYFKLVDESSDKLPKPVLNWVRSNERMLGVFKVLKEIDAEKKVLEDNQSWRAAKLTQEVEPIVDSNRAILEQIAGQFAKNRLKEALANIKTFSDQAEIIRFETSKKEKELAEQGINQRASLGQLSLYRPKMPAENWNYWKFDGEFWRDEIGYYQYTLKKMPECDALNR
jgi:hypothetical protein